MAKHTTGLSIDENDFDMVISQLNLHAGQTMLQNTQASSYYSRTECTSPNAQVEFLSRLRDR